MAKGNQGKAEMKWRLHSKNCEIFQENQLIEVVEAKTLLKPHLKPAQLKTRSIPNYLQEAVITEKQQLQH